MVRSSAPEETVPDMESAFVALALGHACSSLAERSVHLPRFFEDLKNARAVVDGKI